MSTQTTLLSAAIAALLVYLSSFIIHRLFLSPIAHVPGPKLAALTHLYEGYYQLYPYKGRFIWRIKALHDIYGPVVRIGPNEVHVSDPDFFSEIYAGGARRRDKDGWYEYQIRSGGVGAGSSFLSLPHELHRRRRQGINPSFSKKMVRELEGGIWRKCEVLVGRLEAVRGTGTVLDLYLVASALTTDVITEYSFGTALGMISQPEFGRELISLPHDGIQMNHFGRQFPFVMSTMLMLPPWLKLKLKPGMAIFAEFMRIIRRQVQKAFDESSVDGVTQRTVVHELLQSDMAAEEKEFKRIMGETSILVGAGTETTARTIAVTIFHVLRDAAVRQTLTAELKAAMPTVDSEPSLAKLERLPYLTAVVSEGLRVAHGVAGRSPRIAPAEDLVCRGIRLPAGTRMSTALYHMHMNEDIFPQPHEFIPQRWIGAEAEGRSKYLVPFGKGSRNCLGMHLAYAEVYMCIAIVFRRLELELFETGARDVETVEEHFIGMMPHDSKGIRVKVLGVVTE